MCNSIFIGCFCVVFHCNTYELYRPFSIQTVIHIGLKYLIQPILTLYLSDNIYMGGIGLVLAIVFIYTGSYKSITCTPTFQ